MVRASKPRTARCSLSPRIRDGKAVGFTGLGSATAAEQDIYAGSRSSSQYVSNCETAKFLTNVRLWRLLQGTALTEMGAKPNVRCSAECQSGRYPSVRLCVARSANEATCTSSASMTG